MHPLFHPLFVDYCGYFNGNEDYFECHEVLEEYWKEIAPGEKRHPLVGYIQLATSLYHWRRENIAGASRMLQNAIRIFEQHQGDEFFTYINYSRLLNEMRQCLHQIQVNAQFRSFKLPIQSEQLQQLVDQNVANQPTLSQPFILNKHMLRDRTEILAARELKKRSRHN